MSADGRELVLQSALDKMGRTADSSGPEPLIPALLAAFKARGIAAGIEDAERLAEALVPDNPNETLSLKFGPALRDWDHLEAGTWTGDTTRHSRERRDRIYELLGVSESWRALCEDRHPPRLLAFQHVPIIGAEWTHWYTVSRRQSRSFCWSSYERYLRDIKRWPAESVQDLDRDASAVMGRLADPEASGLVSVRGLVVGYVQSGKTANFTAVAAKAVDAGYRLIIVLAGTLNVLRNQTQRRLDKELLGKEVIEQRPNDDGVCDYVEDREWDEFVSYGDLPEHLGGPAWQRLTTANGEYQSLKNGLAALEFKKLVPGRPFNDPRNLHADAARLLVIKKSPSILKKLLKDLKRLRLPLAEVPALIIDDESDLASVNTLPARASKKEEQRRTKTNAAIVELLRLLPRSSYVGYTATPAATVLMNDREELFPRDFIIPLPKPTAYMGVSEFVDSDDLPAEERFREACFVRKVQGADDVESNLPRAIDMFVLAGCIKIHRERVTGRRFRHHTMLVHRSHQMKEHERDRLLVLDYFAEERFTSGVGIARLIELLKTDAQAVCAQLASAGRVEDVGPLPSPAMIPELLAEFFQRVHDERVLVANGDSDNEDRAPDFDVQDVWAILVGGTKLSRGYTVEGLTISYYRRKVAAADTLMQMGRWFGYRQGYLDLVRVFFGCEERKGKGQGKGKATLLDLHEEFRACALDEERFREQLSMYAEDEEHPLLPRDVPPLIFSSGGLLPTSTNKLRHARRAFANHSEQHAERTLAPKSKTEIEANWKAFERMCSGLVVEESEFRLVRDKDDSQFRALHSVAETAAVSRFLSEYRWARSGMFQDILDFLAGGKGDPEIDRWLLLLPRLAKPKPCDRKFGGVAVDLIQRARVGPELLRYKVFSDPGHSRIAKWLAVLNEKGEGNAALSALRAPRTAVLVVYACRDEKQHEQEPNLGFFCQFPKNALPWKVAFVTDQQLEE